MKRVAKRVLGSSFFVLLSAAMLSGCACGHGGVSAFSGDTVSFTFFANRSSVGQAGSGTNGISAVTSPEGGGSLAAPVAVTPQGTVSQTATPTTNNGK